MKFLYRLCYNLSIISKPFSALLAIFFSLPSIANTSVLVIYCSLGELKLAKPDSCSPALGFLPIFYISFSIWSLFYWSILMLLSFCWIISSVDPN